jgi:anti-sigma B factor antagonist
MAFAIEDRPGTAWVVLAVNGDVDIATAPELRTRLARAVDGHPAVVVDLAAVGFMDSTGLGVLVAAYNRAAAAGRRLVIARPQRIVRNALHLVQVDSVIDVYDSLDDAVASL